MSGRVCFIALLILAGAHCGHRSATCPAVAPAPLPPPPAAHVPDDAATIAAVERSGVRFRPCVGGGRYLLDRAGDRELRSPDLERVQSALFRALPSRWGNTAYIGRCNCAVDAAEMRDPLCIVVVVRDGLVTPVAMAEALAAAAGTGGAAGARVQVEVDLNTPPGPRCSASDPACGPLPYDAQCAEQVGYRPGVKRVPVRVRGGDGGPCAHDGECAPAGCGNQCATTREPSGPGTCPYYPALTPALCGCVAGRCEWFTPGR